MTRGQRWKRVLLPGALGLLAGLGLANAPQAIAPFKPEAPLHRGLDANLYMQTAAEYRACCYQAYNLATRRLKELHEADRDKGKKLAVVMDLDETVFDNAGFQAMLLRSGLAYDQRLWDPWEQKNTDRLGLIPGARDFIREAERLDVTVCYISNRDEKFREASLAALKRFEIPIKDAKQLKLSTTTSNKTARRAEVESEFRVLLYVGDSLRDFDEKFRSSVDNTKEPKTTDPIKLEAAIKERKDKVDQTREKWGKEWIILPNPAYGEWMKPLGLGKRDLDRLVGEPPAKDKK